MCGRYYIEVDEKDLEDIVNEVEKKMRKYPEQLTLKTSGEIFPTDIVPVQVGVNEYLPMKWGFVGFNGKPVINARSETALDKPMFQKAMLERRCLIPASGYYEWQKIGSQKTKFKLYVPDSPLYLAGCYREEANSSLFNFVILTRQAGSGIENIHDRMPVIITHKHKEKWLYENPNALEYAVMDLEYEAV